MINYYFNKEYKYITNLNQNIKFYINKSNIYLYDNKEIFSFSNNTDEKEIFLQNFINENEIDYNSIKNNYSSLNLNKKYFILVKIIEKDSKKNFVSFLNDKMFLEQYKYLYEELFIIKNIENYKNKDKIIVLYNNYVLYLLKFSINLFVKLYLLIKNNYEKLLNSKTKEKIIKVLMQKQQY
jgi:hypothetical protein